MWLYFNKIKVYAQPAECASDCDIPHCPYIHTTSHSSIEEHEHALRVTIQPETLYGVKWELDGTEYQFDRFDHNGSGIFVRSE